METHQLNLFQKIFVGVALTLTELFAGYIVSALPIMMVAFGGYSNQAVSIFLHPLSIVLYILIIASIIGIDRLVYRSYKSSLATVSCVQIILSFLLLCVYTVFIISSELYEMTSLFSACVLFVLPGLTVLIGGCVNGIIQILE